MISYCALTDIITRLWKTYSLEVINTRENANNQITEMTFSLMPLMVDQHDNNSMSPLFPFPSYPS